MKAFFRIFKSLSETKEEVFSFSVIIGKIIAFIGILICIGLPITDILGFWLVFISALLLVSGKYRLSLKRFALIILIALVVVLAKGILPRAAIQEGHNIFITKTNGEALERGLPLQVFVYMKDLFLKRYPENKRCDPQTCSGVCWTGQLLPESTFAFSSDSVLLKPKYSRIVDSINFRNLTQFRGNFVNDLKYNWYGGPDNIQRENMPFFVMYELSAACANSSLCWRGHVLWESVPGNFIPIFHPDESCRKILPEDKGKRVFGVSIDNDTQLGFWDQFKVFKSKLKFIFNPQADNPLVGNREQLVMKLKLSPMLKTAACIKISLTIIGAVIILLLSVKINWRHLVIPLIFISIASAVTFCYTPHLFGQYFIHEGGEDGLTHQTYGRNILKNAIEGNWGLALKGEQDVYWDTPGFRYFRALEKFGFGDTNLGYLLVTLLLPYVWYLFLSRFIARIWAFWTTIVFLLTYFPVEGLGFSYYLYVMVTRGGWPDTLGYISFLTAIWLASKYYPIRGAAYIWYGFIAHFLLFITVFMRPNFCVAALIIILYLAFKLFREKRFKEIFFSWMGFLPIILMPLHNYWFGKKFYLFTGAIDLAVTTPPAMYFNAFKELLSSDFNGENFRQIMLHIKAMIGFWYRVLFLIPVFFAAFTRIKIPSDLRMLAFVVLALHAVNLFVFAVFFRYVFLTWALTVMVTISLVCLWFDIHGRRRVANYS